MPVTVSFAMNAVIGGEALTESKNITAKQANIRKVSVPGAKTGALSTRTDDTDGEATLSSGHGITDGARIDIYWSGGSRRGATVGTVADTVVPFTGGSGDNLPAATTSLKVAVAQNEVFPITGSDIVALFASAPKRGTVIFASGTDTEELARILPAGTVFNWQSGRGETNPITGDTITRVFLSHEDTAAQDMVVGAAFN